MPKLNPHPHVSWRNGRPRFQPGPQLRELGYEGKNLRHDDGTWFSKGETVDWSIRFQKELDLKRRPAGKKPATAPRVAAYTVARMLNDWQGSKGNPRFREGQRKAYSRKTVYFYQTSAKILEEDHPLIWNAPVSVVKRPQLRAAFEETWNKRGLASARAMILTLSSALSWAILRGRAARQDNPARGMQMEVPDARVRFGTRREIAALIAAADALGRPEIGDMVMLAVWTGQRQGDRLAFSDTAMLNGRRIFRQGKTSAIVAIKTVPELDARLQAAGERRKVRRAQELLAAKNDAQRAAIERRFRHVILDEKHWRKFNTSHYRHIFAEVRDAAVKGVTDGKGRQITKPCKSLADFWDLDLRDTAVTWMGLAGATIPEIIAVTGHTAESATRILKHYLARHPEMADSAIGKMLAWYDGGGETEFGF